MRSEQRKEVGSFQNILYLTSTPTVNASHRGNLNKYKVTKILGSSHVFLTFKTASSSSKSKWDLYYVPLSPKTCHSSVFSNLNLHLPISTKIHFLYLFSWKNLRPFLLAIPQPWLHYRMSENKKTAKSVRFLLYNFQCNKSLSRYISAVCTMPSDSQTWPYLRVIWGTFKATDAWTPSTRDCY